MGSIYINVIGLQAIITDMQTMLLCYVILVVIEDVYIDLFVWVQP